MPKRYKFGDTVLRFNLFPNNPQPGTQQPSYGQSNLIIETSVPPGRYTVGAWNGEDGQIGIKIQEKLDDDDTPDSAPAESPSRFSVER